MKKIKEFMLGMAWLWLPLIAMTIVETLCRILL